ncbi:Trp operon repressor family [Lachnospiraceae bacterium XBB1006]|nr:Trp operon repressor family [Lachnospiraceae bacterium XBB1006]
MGKRIEKANMDLLVNCFLSLKDKNEAQNFFEDLCTIKELQDISQRLEVAQLLMEKKKYQEIASMTGASTATISRVNRSLMYGNNSYETIIQRVHAE